MCPKCLYRLLVLLGMAAFTLAVAAAQTGEIIIVKTADAALSESQVREAAATLTNRGASVAVYFVMTGDQADFLTRLQRSGLAAGSAASPDVIAIYVATEDRYSEIRWGQTYDRQLEPVGRDLRSTRLNPGLRSGDYTAAFVNTLTGIDEVLAGTYESSGISGSSSSAPTLDLEKVGPMVLILLLIASWVYCLVTGKCRSSSTTSGSSSSYRSSSSSRSSSSGGSSRSGGGHDGGSWND